MGRLSLLPCNGYALTFYFSLDKQTLIIVNLNTLKLVENDSFMFVLKSGIIFPLN